MISIGIDLSLVHTGVVVLNSGKLVEKKSIITKPEGKRPVDEIMRLQTIINQIVAIIDAHSPTIVGIEGIAFGVGKTTALAQLSGLNYLLRKELMIRDIAFVIAAPSSLKKFVTGKGNAQKDEVMLAVYKRWGVTFTDNNECDAYGLAQLALSIYDPERKINSNQKSVISLISSQIHG